MPVHWDIPSQEDPTKIYRVTFDGEKFSCTCPDYVFRAKKLVRDCKHIYAVKVAEGLLTTPPPPKKTEAEKKKDRKVVEQPLDRHVFVSHPMVKPDTIEDREYQRNMVEEALKNNTLVVLPTALGKTVIAELAAAELLHRHPGCRILVMAPTKPLVLQHRQSFLKHLNISEDEAVAVTGETGESVRKMAWGSPSVRIVFSTPQTAYNDYRRGWVRLEEFALLVFDECHRSRSRYAYTRLASEYVRSCPWPRILALTASPGSDEDRVMEVVKNLWIEKISWRSEEHEEVSSYIPGVKVDWVRVKLPKEYEEIRSAIKAAIENRVRQLQGFGVVRMPLKNVTRAALVQAMNRLRTEISSGIKGRNMHYMAMISEVLSLYHALELIESQHVYSLRQYLNDVKSSELRSHRMLASSGDFHRIAELAEKCSLDHPKVEALLNRLSQHFSEKPGDRVMVFANIRNTAEVVTWRLSQLGYRAKMFVGKGEGKEGPKMSQEEQMRVLKGFREGEFNILVATSIGEEGLDIPECGYVIFYEPAISGIRYIQRRGRTGRRLPGKVTILLAEDTVDEYYFAEGYRRAKKMAKLLEKVAKKLEGFKLGRKGPEPEPGKPWPWLRQTKPTEYVQAEDGEPVYVTARKISHGELFACRKRLYELILNSGEKGLSFADALQAVEYDPDIVRMSINRLVGEGLVVKAGDRYVAKAAVKAAKAPSKVHTIRVEKVYPGFAVVVVDDSFRARLEPATYQGPRDLLKKGKTFKAIASFIRIDGAMTVNIHDVVATEASSP
ncbi:MAG: helicase-related protein [Candidatus Caldarchaeum sp.]